MSDEELVCVCAVEVMGWKWYRTANFRAIAKECPSNWRECDDMTLTMVQPAVLGAWRPLSDWKHTMQVVDAMRAKDWIFNLTLNDIESSTNFLLFGETIADCFSAYAKIERKPQRAILEAALQAVRAMKGATT